MSGLVGVALSELLTLMADTLKHLKGVTKRQLALGQSAVSDRPGRWLDHGQLDYV